MMLHYVSQVGKFLNQVASCQAPPIYNYCLSRQAWSFVM